MSLKVEDIQSVQDAVQFVLENIEDIADQDIERMKFTAWCELMERGYYEEGVK